LGDELVECRAGFIYPQTPVAFTWHDQRLVVEKLIAEWRTQDGWKFRVLASNDQLFDLFYNEMYDQWLITPA
jgi:hypothetical protein